MIVADSFVFLHFPKTGGIFVSEILKKIDPSCREIRLPNLKRVYGGSDPHIHGTYSQIPAEHRGKPVVSCMRNPFDRYVSTYEYRQWARDAWTEEREAVGREYPRFPDLTFAEFLSFISVYDVRSRVGHELLKTDLGFMTFAFIQFFFREPLRILAALSDAWDAAALRTEMAAVRFLRTESLNQDLYLFLRETGYSERAAARALETGRLNVTSTRPPDRPWRDYYDRETLEFVSGKERFLFKMFPEYRLDYSFGRAI